MADIARLTQIIEPEAQALGFELVRVLLSGQRRKKLQIMAEPLDGSPMNVDLGTCRSMNSAVGLTSNTTAEVSLAAASNASGDSARVPRAITSSMLSYPPLFIATFSGK